LGLVFTLLAKVALVGLRSEGIDRRRAEASLIADRELGVLESLIAMNTPLEAGQTTKELEPYRIAIDIQPEDVMGLLPTPLREDIARNSDDELATLLVDDRGESRVQRLQVVVEWDEGAETERVERITHTLDMSELAALFPAEAEPEEGIGSDEEPEPSLEEQLGGNAPVDFQRLLEQAQDSH
jgi:hypothetical protein